MIDPHTLCPALSYQDHALHIEGVSVAALVEQYGSPLYVYSQSALVMGMQRWLDAVQGHSALVCYAVKANSNLALLALFSRLGAGFDIVSGGELQRVLRVGADPKKVVFSGIGKTAQEMRMALRAGILCFNVESVSELDRLNAVAGELGVCAPISLRINPEVDPKTHPYIATGLRDSKFGIPWTEAEALYVYAARLSHVEIKGIDCHIGSQLLDMAPLLEACDRLLELVDRLVRLQGITFEHIDLGGGLGIRYQDEAPMMPHHYVPAVLAKLKAYGIPSVLFEPGRSIVGNAGVLVTQVEYLKRNGDTTFAVVDAAMNDLMRPSLYDAWHGVVPVQQDRGEITLVDLVGPICESGDWLARKRSMAIEQGSLLAILSAGAYGMTMSSNYNTRPRAAEILVSDRAVQLIAARETIDELLQREYIPEFVFPE